MEGCQAQQHPIMRAPDEIAQLQALVEKGVAVKPTSEPHYG
jgi:hypothetical protein